MSLRTLLAAALCAAVGLASAAGAGARPLTLDECVRTALSQHPDVRAAEAALDNARATRAAALGNYLPQGGFTYTTQRTTANYVVKPGVTVPSVLPPISGNLLNFHSGSLSVTQTLYDFGRTGGAYGAAAHSAGAAEGDLADVRSRTALVAVQSYFEVLKSRALLALADSTLQQQRSHEDQAKALYQVGRRARIDAVTAEANRANAELAQEQAQNALALARQTLALAMGIDDASDLEPQEADLPAMPEENDTTGAPLAQAQQARPDYLAQAERVEAQRGRVHAARGELLPNLSAGAGFTWQGEDFGSLANNFSVQVGVSVPIFNMFINGEKTSAASAELARQEAVLAELKQQVRLDLTRAQLNVREGVRRVDVTAVAERAATEQLRLAEARYQTGAGSILELGDAQVAATNAGSNSISARYDLSVARATLAQALGKQP